MNKFLVLENYWSFAKKHIIASSAKWINRLKNNNEKFYSGQCSPVFIIGLPRSGSTIAYQLLTSYLNVEYISNYLERRFYFPFYFFSKQLKLKPKTVNSSFKSEFGETDKSNQWEPNQGINFWYNWMPSELHYHELSDFKSEQLDDLERAITKMLSMCGKSIVFKELSLSQKLPVLISLFPKSKFIIIERNSSDVASSIFRAMEKNHIPEGIMWGVQFKGFEKYLDFPRKEMIAYQVKELEQSLARYTSNIAKERILKVRYEDMCDEPETFVKACSEFIDCEIISTFEMIGSAINRRSKTNEMVSSFNKLFNS